MRSTCFATSFAVGVGDEIVGLGGETDEHLPAALARTETGEDVGRRLEHDLRAFRRAS